MFVVEVVVKNKIEAGMPESWHFSDAEHLLLLHMPAVGWAMVPFSDRD